MGLSDNLLNVISNEKTVLSIYSPDYNELINDRIPYQFTKKAHFIQSDKKAEKPIQRNYSYVFEFLKSLGVNEFKDVKTTYPLYKTYNYNNAEYFVVNDKRILFENVKNTFKLFAKKYADKKKIIVFEHILGLGIYKKASIRELFKQFADADPDAVVLLNTEANNHFFKRNSRSSYLKNLPLKSDEKRDKINLKKFLKGVVTEGSAVYVASANNLSFLFGGEI